MINGMHVRSDWDCWIEKDDKENLRSLCGKRTTTRYAGIPTIRLGQSMIHQPKPKSPRSPGWCPRCMQLFLDELMAAVYGPLQKIDREQAEPLLTIYKNAAVFTAQAVNEYRKMGLTA